MTTEEMIDSVVSEVSLRTVGKINAEMQTVMNGTADKVTEKLVTEMKRQKLINRDPKGIYKKTELLLYAYSHFQDLIKDKQGEICELQTFGLQKRSSGITSFSSSASPDMRSEYEKIVDRLDIAQQELEQVNRWVMKVEDGLKAIASDPYFCVIQEHYFQGRTYESIAEDRKVSVDIIRNNKNRLVSKLEMKLFRMEYVQQIMEQIRLI